MTRFLLLSCLLLGAPAAHAGEIHALYLATGGWQTKNVEVRPFGSRIGDHGITEIGIERTPCFGQCPDYVFIVRSDGTFRYSGKENVERKGDFTGTVPVEDFNELAEFISQSGFMAMKDGYAAPVTDNPATYTMVVKDGRRKIVNDYAGVGPQTLWAIEGLIDRLLAEAGWN